MFYEKLFFFSFKNNFNVNHYIWEFFFSNQRLSFMNQRQRFFKNCCLWTAYWRATTTFFLNRCLCAIFKRSWTMFLKSLSFCIFFFKNVLVHTNTYYIYTHSLSYMEEKWEIPNPYPSLKPVALFFSSDSALPLVVEKQSSKPQN